MDGRVERFVWKGVRYCRDCAAVGYDSGGLNCRNFKGLGRAIQVLTETESVQLDGYTPKEEADTFDESAANREGTKIELTEVLASALGQLNTLA